MVLFCEASDEKCSEAKKKKTEAKHVTTVTGMDGGGDKGRGGGRYLQLTYVLTSYVTARVQIHDHLLNGLL